MSKISIVVAVAEDRAIGKDNHLLWRLPNDMKFFRKLTTGHTIIMGRKTFESFPKGALPNRKNVVITSDPKAAFPNTSVVHSIDEAIHTGTEGEELFFIGGAKVYEAILPIADKLYLTLVHHSFPDADTFFPEFDIAGWEQTEYQECLQDEEHPYAYTFVTYQRKCESQ